MQVCGVVACLNQSLNSCGYINYNVDTYPGFPTLRRVNITANFATHKNSFVMPSLVDYRLNTIEYKDYSFDRTNKTTNLLTKNLSPRMMAVGIVAHSWPNSASFIQISKLSLLFAAILFLKQSIF